MKMKNDTRLARRFVCVTISELIQSIDPSGSYNHPLRTAWSKLRSCFDPLCAEWQWHPLEEKLQIIHTFMDYDVSFEQLVESYCVTEKRDYVIMAVPDAIYYLASYLPEAASYYMTSPRCEEHKHQRGIPTFNAVLDKAEEIIQQNL